MITATSAPTGTTPPQAARDKLIQDFNAVVADSEQLLKAIGAAGGEKTHALRASLEENLQHARQRLAQLEAGAAEKVRASARATDEYVHSHPWQSIGIVAAISAIVGIVLGLLLNRR